MRVEALTPPGTGVWGGDIWIFLKVLGGHLASPHFSRYSPKKKKTNKMQICGFVLYTGLVGLDVYVQAVLRSWLFWVGEEGLRR